MIDDVTITLCVAVKRQIESTIILLTLSRDDVYSNLIVLFYLQKSAYILLKAASRKIRIRILSVARIIVGIVHFCKQWIC